MKILQTEIALKLNSLFTVLERDEQFFNSPLHVHPEFEMVYIKESAGKRIVGNRIEKFSAGDVVLMGPNLPHIWINDDEYVKGQAVDRARSIIIYFHPRLFENGFFDLEEAAPIRDLLKSAKKGIVLSGKTRAAVAGYMERLLLAQGFKRVLLLLEMLECMAVKEELAFINSVELLQHESRQEKDRLCDVYKFVNENFRGDIQLKDVARLTNLTPQSFCRLFKKRNNLHFVEYLNQVRINNACRMLLDTDWTISEIAYNCGYKTISNFNKLFKETTGYAPKSYRDVAKAAADRFL